jgi:hypothetical protein
MTMSDLSPLQYKALVAEIAAATADDFRKSPDHDSRREACRRYFKRGQHAGRTTGELVDFLAVSSPSILGLAGYSEEQVNAVMELVSELTDEEIARTQL